MNRRSSSARARVFVPPNGEAEYFVLNALKNNGFEAEHATPEEDLDLHFDVRLHIGGFEIWIDVTTSTEELEGKLESEDCRNGYVVVVFVRIGWWSEEELARETLRQVICSLPERVKTSLLREMAT